MDLLRKQIIERIKGRADADVPWVLDVYCYLMQRGATPDEATKAMTDFVDDVIAFRAKRLESVE